MIEIKNLTKKFKDKIAVNNISLTINEGELFALLGTNGAGKTTTIKMMSTLILPTSGEMKVEGYDIRKDNMKIKEIINVSPQETAIAPNLSVKENLEFMAGVYKIKNKDEKINELIEIFKLQEVLKQKAKTLSGGWQRKLSIAISLINNPKILFLDEPTIGLDAVSKVIVRNFIKDINKKKNVTIILTTHDMRDIESLANRLIIIGKGKKLYDGDIKDIKEKYTKNKIVEIFFSDLKKIPDIKNTKIVSKEKDVVRILIDTKKISVSSITLEYSKVCEIKDVNIIEKGIDDIIYDLYQELGL